MQTLHTIHLHGHLKQFGEQFKFAVDTPLEATRFLALQIDGFTEAMMEGSYRLVRGNIDTATDYDYEQLSFGFGDVPQDFHFIPVLQGAGGSDGVGKAIFGAVLMVGALIAAPFTGGASGIAIGSVFGTGIAGTLAKSALIMGAAIMLGGVSSLLAPSINPTSLEKVDERPSYFLSSPINMVEQGGAIPILYGKFMCGSNVINAAIEVVDI